MIKDIFFDVIFLGTNMPYISVIIPVYNSANYLEKCINSILCQSFQDFELILIDDGSTDNSGIICDQFAETDKRFSVFHKSNGGVSSARNLGIEKAVGEWIYFVDADDWLEPLCLEQFCTGISEDVDLVVQSYIVENGHLLYGNSPKKNKQIYSPAFPNKTFKEPYRFIELLEQIRYTHCGWIWHRLFKRSIIEENNVRFHEDTSFGEDEVFFLEYIKYAQKINTLSTIGYHYVLQANGLTSKVYPLQFYIINFQKYWTAIDGIDGNWCFNHLFKKKYINKFIDSWFVFLFSNFSYDEKVFGPVFQFLRRFVIEKKLYLLPCQSLTAFLYRFSLIFVMDPSRLYQFWWNIKRLQNKFHI